MALATTMGAAFALAHTRQMALVKNSPTHYGTNGFDISSVDNSPQKYYLADRTNNAIHLVNAAAHAFLGFIGKGQYTGSRARPGRPGDLRCCAARNGVVTDNLGHVWAGDGAGNIIEVDATKAGTANIRKIATGGKFRVDEMPYDPTDPILMASSDGDSPPFLTFLSVEDGAVLEQYHYPAGREGMEQPDWVHETGWFYQSAPGDKNRIDAIDPHKVPSPVMSFRVECKGGALSTERPGGRPQRAPDDGLRKPGGLDH
jgi:hypothetical protein